MENKIPSFLVVTRYKEPFRWIEEYTDTYLVYNKGEPVLNNFHIYNSENVGGNQRDILHFAYECYDALPNPIAFIQANPFDHCKRETFNKLIHNYKFTSLEDYTHLENTHAHVIDKYGGYTEINNSWYIPAHNGTYGLTCKYSSFDEFMNKYFEDYEHVDWIRFAPGSQYIVEKEQFLAYPKNFWKCMVEELTENNMTEAHIIERAMWYILNHKYSLRKEFYDKK